MNCRLKSLCTVCLFLNVLVNSERTEKGNSSFNSSKNVRTNDTFGNDNTNTLNENKSDEKLGKCRPACEESSPANGNQSVRNVTNFQATKSNENSTEPDGTGGESNFGAENSTRKSRKLDKYQWKREVFTGRGKEMEFLLPLVIGFKLTGAIASGFTAVKIFLLQSMFIAKLAVIASAFLLLKSFRDFKHKPMMHKPATSVGFGPYYDYAIPYHSVGLHDGLGYPFGYDNGQWQGVASVSGDSDIGTAKDDLDTQYSDGQPVVSAELGRNNTNPSYSNNYYSRQDYTASDRLSNSSVREKYRPQIIGYETYIKRITTEKLDD